MAESKKCIALLKKTDNSSNISWENDTTVSDLTNTGNAIIKSLVHSSNQLSNDSIKDFSTKLYSRILSGTYIRQAIHQYESGFIYKVNNQIVANVIWRKRRGVHIKGCNIKNHNDVFFELLLVCADPDNTHLWNIIVNDIRSYCLRKNIKYIANMLPIQPGTIKLANIYNKYKIKILSTCSVEHFGLYI